jgi:hypothetical protein
MELKILSIPDKDAVAIIFQSRLKYNYDKEYLSLSLINLVHC